MKARERLLASCPHCKHSLRVLIGRKAETRCTRCENCRRVYEYSAWQLSKPRVVEGEGVSLSTFYQVDMFEQK